MHLCFWTFCHQRTLECSRSTQHGKFRCQVAGHGESLFLTSIPTMECCHSPPLASYRCLRIVLRTHEIFKGRTYTEYMETHPQSVNPAEECRSGVLTSLSIFSPSFNGSYVCL
ncbi:hypothetical protein M441DRAFT_224750 [Trichoderma asperellum CBS 433.97]|uniref:Uncharacterized protein n=1 Tax=Trichoderma asperellum (strain ATCC 204424 / CBS 433.97 / NBRC 101777) TaxID=1042311 RepID=A0A2T3ZPS9_TRIA4|nr:hypothetical protein M441DRAFT_224750 [Trichoderma asperellum CBS 433.97]PTB46801.1 hypothetical protein M441DRAFT_224750 [Trichoderma asperellum CBS 433.97]